MEFLLKNTKSLLDSKHADNAYISAKGKDVIVIGQSAGGGASIALSSLNPPPVKAIITFEAGRGGRVDGKPNNNCAPDKLVEATGEFVNIDYALAVLAHSLRLAPGSELTLFAMARTAEEST